LLLLNATDFLNKNKANQYSVSSNEIYVCKMSEWLEWHCGESLGKQKILL